MENKKKILEFFECRAYGQYLERIQEGKIYMQEGSENLPIDVSDSLCFMNDLEEIFKGIIYSPNKREVVQEGKNHKEKQLLDVGACIHLEECNKRLHFLRADMRRILTDDNLEQYIRVIGMVESLIKIFEDYKA